MSLTHLDARGGARMVDVSDKQISRRTALAEGLVSMSVDAFRQAMDPKAAKGDVLAAARLAGIMGAKRTSELIPLCHPLPLDSVTVDLVPDESASHIVIRAEVRVTARTGAEMEALTAVSLAALTIYDMVKAADPGMVIGQVRLIKKEGGRSGEYLRQPER